MVARAVSARRTRVPLGSEARMIALQAPAPTSRERAMETSAPSTPEVAAARTTAIGAIGAEGDKRYRAERCHRGENRSRRVPGTLSGLSTETLPQAGARPPGDEPTARSSPAGDLALVGREDLTRDLRRGGALPHSKPSYQAPGRTGPVPVGALCRPFVESRAALKVQPGSADRG